MKTLIEKQAVVVLLLLLSVHYSVARQYTVSGYVSDSVSSETMISAAVYDTVSVRGTVTNTYGFYSLTLPEGKCVLRFSYVGYRSQMIELDLKGDTAVSVRLNSSTTLDEVVVTGHRSEIGVHGTQMSAIEVPMQMIKNIPALAGEVDVIKALQLLPGVQSGSEGGTGLYVRGGGPDENLVLLDGIPLYNVNHLGGFFSVFNADALKNVTLYKGNFPARFGSRLSSVVDVRQKDGDARSYHGNVSVGLLSAKFNVEGPIWKDHTTFNISARRTYYDLLAQPIMAIFASMNEMDRMMAGYYFYDLNARISHKFSDRDRLTLSFYMGDDVVYVNMLDKGDDYRYSNKMNWRWGNLVTSLNWQHVFSPKLFANASVSYTKYRFSLGMKNEQTDIYEDETEKYLFDVKYNTYIDDVMANYDLDYKPHPNHDLRFGTNYTLHRFRPAVMTYMEVMDVEMADTTFGGKRSMTHEVALYAEDNWTIHRVVKANIGLRGSLYVTDNKVYPSIEPRLGLRFLITDALSAKASYSYMTQYVHLLSSSNLTLPTDLWVPVTKRIPPMHSHQVAAGFFYNLLGQVDFSIEGYYKTMRNMIEYKDGASFFLSTTGWEDKVNIGDGYSYGVEFLVQRSVGKITGWVGYTWSRTMRKFDRPGMEINFGKEFPAKYDRRHDVSVVLQYKPTKRIDLSATFIYGTGTCGTFATQLSPSGNPVITSRNNFRMPDYHRLDIGANFHFPRKKNRKGEHLLGISVYNVYNNKNPFMVYVGTKDDGSGDPALRQVSIFPILPSISYSFKF